jgi:hypothetical protein
MNLQENISRIKQMMGLISEQGPNFELPKDVPPWNPDYEIPSTYEFQTLSSDEIKNKEENNKPLSFSPKTISDSYTSPISNCDRLHAFNDTGSGPVGRMNDIVNPELIKIYESGINPDITDVTVNIERGKTKYTVNWSVTIDESKDGVAYVGLYSRGHGGQGNWVFSDVSTTSGNASIESCKKSNFIKKRGTVEDMKLIKDFEYNKDGKIPGCQVNQLFYKYTLKEYPPNKNK